MRTVPPHVIRVIRFRDGGTCRFPGCTQTTRICYHHLQPWSQGGHTDPSNIIGLCPFHHWGLHEGGWRAEGNPAGRLRFYDPHGRLYEPRPKRLRPDIRHQILGPPPEPPPEEPPLADTS